MPHGTAALDPVQAFAHLLPPGDVVDAGANDGAFLIKYLPTCEANLGDAAEHVDRRSNRRYDISHL